MKAAATKPKAIARNFVTFYLRDCLIDGALTKRAGWTTADDPAWRKQDPSNWGQTCREQLSPTGRSTSRFPLASAAVSLAATCGAKSEEATSNVARSANIAHAARGLIIWGV
jgi:hypothetical protein